MVTIAPLVVALSFLAQFSALAVPIPFSYGVGEVSIYERSSQGGGQNPPNPPPSPDPFNGKIDKNLRIPIPMHKVKNPLVVKDGVAFAGMKRKRSDRDVGGRQP